MTNDDKVIFHEVKNGEDLEKLFRGLFNAGRKQTRVMDTQQWKSCQNRTVESIGFSIMDLLTSDARCFGMPLTQTEYDTKKYLFIQDMAKHEELKKAFDTISAHILELCPNVEWVPDTTPKNHAEES